MPRTDYTDRAAGAKDRPHLSSKWPYSLIYFYSFSLFLFSSNLKHTHIDRMAYFVCIANVNECVNLRRKHKFEFHETKSTNDKETEEIGSEHCRFEFTLTNIRNDLLHKYSMRWILLLHNLRFWIPINLIQQMFWLKITIQFSIKYSEVCA